MSLNKIWLFFNSIAGLCFGITMFQVMDQSRPFRKEAVSHASTFKAVGIGIISGLVFLAIVTLLGTLYVKAKPTPGKLEIRSILLRVLIGAVIGGSIGATFYGPFLGLRDLAVVFIDYHGVLLYFTGAIGGGVGAAIGGIGSTQTASWWVRIVVALGAGLVGMVVGFIIGSLFIALFTAPFTRRIG
jgi:hypothetical protein